MDLPGGIVLVGGVAVLPGITELAQEIFGVSTKLYVPNQIGIRNPAFAQVISLVEYVGSLDEVEMIAQSAVNGEATLRQKPIDIPFETPKVRPAIQSVSKEIPREVTPEPVEEQSYASYTEIEEDEAKVKITDRIRGLFGSMFE